PTIRMPSNPDEKYSALWWPKGWSSSAGRAATVTMASANMALARLTNDSMASDSKPTDPEPTHAKVLSAMVIAATATDAHNRWRGVNQRCDAGKEVDMKAQGQNERPRDHGTGAELTRDRVWPVLRGRL